MCLFVCLSVPAQPVPCPLACPSPLEPVRTACVQTSRVWTICRVDLLLQVLLPGGLHQRHGSVVPPWVLLHPGRVCPRPLRGRAVRQHQQPAYVPVQWAVSCRLLLHRWAGAECGAWLGEPQAVVLAVCRVEWCCEVLSVAGGVLYLLVFCIIFGVIL